MAAFLAALVSPSGIAAAEQPPKISKPTPAPPDLPPDVPPLPPAQLDPTLAIGDHTHRPPSSSRTTAIRVG
jgi:hypothetical protein